MTERRKGSFSFYLQIVILLAVLLVISTVLVRVFAAAQMLRRETEARNDAAEICRSAAEAFSSCGTADGTIRLMGGSGGDTLRLDRSLQAAQDGCYTLTVTVTAQPRGAGELARAALCVTDAGGAALAQLDTEKYLPQ